VGSSEIQWFTAAECQQSWTQADQASPLVSFFLRNSCRYGERCRFPHPTANRTGKLLAPPAAATRLIDAVAVNQVPSSSHHQQPDGVLDPVKWIQAPVFIPKSSQPPSFANIVGQNYMNTFAPTKKPIVKEDIVRKEELCPFLLAGVCYYDNCVHTHGDLCELCQRHCLHPTNMEQRRKHNLECVAQHEKDMELSFAIAKSKDKTCGVCFEIIMEKPGREQRFGILPNCQHCFCLECIRKWRQAELFDNKIKRACPECRVTSDFVCPSAYWVDTKEEKDKLINDYKHAMTAKDCKYYNKGRGKCPFGNKCFYRHALPDGTLVDVGFPPRPVRRLNHLGELEELEEILFWDLLRVGRIRIPDDVVSMLSSSDLDDWLYD